MSINQDQGSKMTANFHDADVPQPPNEEECRKLLAEYGSLAKWEMLCRGGWTFDMNDTVKWIDALMWTGQLDRAHVLSIAALPKLLAEPLAKYPDELFWSRSIGTMARCITLADSPESALQFIEQAIKVAKTNSLANDQVCILMGAVVYPILINGNAELYDDALTATIKIIDLDCLRWVGLAKRELFDLMLLADISTRIIEAFQLALVAGAEVPLNLAETAIYLYRLHKECTCFETPAEGTKEQGILAFALRHLAAGAAFASRLTATAGIIDPKDRQVSLTGPLAFDILFVELFAHEGLEFFSTGNALIQSVHAWRSAICTTSTRAALRRHLSALHRAVMGRLKQVVRIDLTSEGASLLANAEEVFGTARHIYDRLSGAVDPSTDLPLMMPAMCLPDRPSLGSNVVVVQAIEDDRDLLLIAHRGMPTTSGYGPAQIRRIKYGAHNLGVVAYKYLGSPTGPGQMHSETQRKLLADLPQGSPDSERRRLLDKMVEQFGAQASCILAGALDDLNLDGCDVLFVGGSPQLFQLPLSILRCGDKRLIERVRSLTISPSVEVSHFLAARPTAAGTFELAAYCHTTDKRGRNVLRWERLFDRSTAGRSSVNGAVLRSVHISRSNGQQVDIATLDCYSKSHPECNVLLIAGHGDPAEGIWFADGYWKPEDMTRRGWRLKKTECAVLPSCRIGEMKWIGSGESSDIDPSKCEIDGFTASLYVAGIPRILACPWTCYDLPLVSLIPDIVRTAVELRNSREPHYWARALREAVVEGLRRPSKNFGTYDLANLMLFGAP